MDTALPDKRVLIVDDEEGVRESLRLILGRKYEVAVAENGEAALGMLGCDENGKVTPSDGPLPDLVLLDFVMPGLDGLDILKSIRGNYPDLPVIMLTATTTVRTAVQAMKIGAIDYLNKPYDVDELLSLIDESIANGPAERTRPINVVTSRINRGDIPDVPGDFGRLVGSHALMHELYGKIEQVSKRDTTVLITGESGTGKELVAREIHDRSQRSGGPFIALNCAAIPETLIESELFGHEKGAFTHAIDKRIGHFELADGGTLFLDEIGELSPTVQVKMLRFLQNREFYRVGRSKPIHVDVRVVAATNKSLETAIAEQRFRQDLYYRINVVNLDLPALRDRSEDIRTLFEYFLARFRPLYGNRDIEVSTDAMTLLERYCWPGNVRELENVTESLLALSNKSEIGVEDLPHRLTSGSATGDLRESVVGGMLPFEEANRAFETDIIVRALQKTDYVQTRAAELLGISRRILKYKMDKLGISDTPQN